MVRGEMPDAMSIIEGLEWFPPKLDGAGTDAHTVYKVHHENGLHSDLHGPLDPRRISRLWRSGTMCIEGVYVGTDKIGHFVDMGYRYFKVFDAARRAGTDPDAAMHEAVRFGQDDLVLGENYVLGRLSAGVYSNADMASNYVGCLFYRNITEPVMLQGQMRPAMLDMVDGRWRVASWVEEDPSFFRWYVSDHFNEALNPSDYEPAMREQVRAVVAERSVDVRMWYVDDDGQPRSPNWFRRSMIGLSTYHGSGYGHTKNFHELAGLGDVKTGSDTHLGLTSP